ncbi:MaoC/PaaZ C-terminal domain-containing protein [Nocardioides sp. W7]|uniref:MaoC/PaaZ C-terminal domain-containing protein n=1 Tax=Nocardioides sp. W7 TaxID=2931390 RepID=UPI001FD09962|nr:MaoC/PaaZ C-terminal domain-containing protein [Nocardioides sp. W7]
MTGTPHPAPGAPAGEWLGCSLGERTASWTDRDAILFALAVGARPDQLDLVFEERLRVLPSFALTLAQWAPDVLGGAGAFDVTNALHGSQVLEARAPMPASGELTMKATVSGVWDKGSAAVYDVTVESDYFLATWSLFAPGRGGFGGERGPSRSPAPDVAPAWTAQLPVADNAAVLYRLLGDRHHIHVDPEAAAGIGQPRPILHGLATLSAATLVLADRAGAHPADLRRLEGRFAAPVFPGETLEVRGWDGGVFDVVSERGPVLAGGLADFA